ncbi:MAG: DNA repair exonuclease [Deltaproteobacteria bacterium]|nr:DNA repair exonuclease [Deltaproteobacteria bacterium]
MNMRIMGNIKVLCIGDVHLGRPSSRMVLEAAQTDSDFPSPRDTLTQTTIRAQRLAVDVVVFSGDVVDQSNAHFEAFGALSNVVKMLAQAGIKVYAVAGNHDYEVLEKLAATIPEFRLLGADGSWEEEVLTLRESKLRIQGKSFTKRHSPDDPVADYTPPQDTIPTLALLHCDLGGDSNYAPVSLSQLESKAPSAWVLGHIHKPVLLKDDPLIFYPGTLHPLDSTETGPHGPWLLEIDPSGKASAKMIALAPLRYEYLRISLDGCDSVAEARTRITKDLSSWREEHLAELEDVQTISLRLSLTGHTAIFSELPLLCQELEENSEELMPGLQIEKIMQNCRPQVPLQTLAAGQDPAGLIARKLLILEQRLPQHDYTELLAAGRRHILAALQQADLPHEFNSNLEDPEVASVLDQAAASLLNLLLSQKEQSA